METPEQFRKPFETALRLLLMRWNLWSMGDEIRALDLAFDCTNTEICISLLTDREPNLDAADLSGLEEPWEVAEWRLNGISSTGKHCFPDAAELVAWMHAQGSREFPEGVDIREQSENLNEGLKHFFFEVVTSSTILSELKRFRRIAKPFQIRVHWFFEQQPPLRYVLR